MKKSPLNPLKKLKPNLKPPANLPYKLPLSVAKTDDQRAILGDLFDQVQKERLFGDSKTFVDMVPSKRLRQIKNAYDLQSRDPDFSLHEFVSRYFYELAPARPNFKSDPNQPVIEHIDRLWSHLTRETPRAVGSLLPLPNKYVVPGGRFNEQFYWDSYFIMLGLAAAGKWRMVEGMVDNFVFMLGKYGLIPTANRTYFLQRSQPPFLSHMVRLLATRYGGAVYAHYLPALVAEYNFWMRGSKRIRDNERPARQRTVRLPSGEFMNRYFSGHTDPRPESFAEDVATAAAADSDATWTHVELRAGAESGWDFSSRWLRVENNLATIHTTDLVPIDLNCLLYDLEKLIAEIYEKLKQKTLAERWRLAAETRAGLITRYLWHSDDGFYYDYDFVAGAQTKRATLAAVFPLWSGVADNAQAARIAERLEREFLAPGGLLTTLTESGQQWDAPNGWAPLQYVAIVGLRNYGFHDLATEIKKRWIDTNLAVYETEGKLVEKYDVRDFGVIGGGGEYPLQDGFGWTNGVLRALLAEQH